jgi:exonuclease III
MRRARNNDLCIISQNVRGLKTNDKIHELSTIIKHRGYFAACIQETWRNGVEDIESDGNRVILNGLDKNLTKSRRGEQGVAIVLSPEAVKAWKTAGSTVHNEFGARIIAVRLQSNDCNDNAVGLFLISAYAPVGVADAIVWEDFMGKLDCCISKKLPGDILIIGCDTNSSIGNTCNSVNTLEMSSVGKFGHVHRNNAGVRFSTYLETNSLVALTTCFRKRSYVTWTHPRSKLPHQIDHFVTEKSSFCNFIDAGAMAPITNSDHRAVMTKLRIKLNFKKRSTSRQKIARLDQTLLHSANIKNIFCYKVGKYYDESDANLNSYSKLEKAMNKAAHETLPKTNRIQTGWFASNENRLKSLIEERNSAISLKLCKPTRSATFRLRKARKELKSEIARTKNNWILNICKELNGPPNRTSIYWDKVKLLRKGLSNIKVSSEKMMKKADGSKCTNSEENAEVFREHFQKLYGRQPKYDFTVLELLERKPIFEGLDHTPTNAEIIKATTSLKNNAPGESGLTPLMFKTLISNKETLALLREVVVDFWNTENAPEQWEVGLLKIIPKKGDLSCPGNYRGIMLLEIAYKIVAKIVHQRLLPIAESLDHESQCGFRPGRGCNDAVFAVKLAMKKRREHSQETWILFLDLVKAFDRVPRELLWIVLERFGVPPKLINILKALHKNIYVKFTIDPISHVLECCIGVKQGDVLGPILFIMFIAAIMVTWRDIRNHPQCTFRTRNDFVLTGRRPTARGEDFVFGDSEYADDTAVLFDSRESIEADAPGIDTHFGRFGMEVHAGHTQIDKPSKTEILYVASRDSVYDNTKLKDVKLNDGKFFPTIDKFSYLGTTLTSDCTDNEDVLQRIKKAGNMFGSLRKCLFDNIKISFRVKGSVYESLILSILLYGCESWCLTENLFRLLRCFHNRCVRVMCGVNMVKVFTDRISTETLLNQLNLGFIDAYICKRQLRWAGHVARMDMSRIPRKMLSSWVNEKRPIGSPEMTYGRTLYKALKKVDIERDNWHASAMIRDDWRYICSNVS